MSIETLESKTHPALCENPSLRDIDSEKRDSGSENSWTIAGVSLFGVLQQRIRFTM
jgi:hypothetical protein